MNLFPTNVSYAQIAVFVSGLEQPFNAWTERHVKQGFSWRPGGVSFATIEESGYHIVQLDVDPSQTDIFPKSLTGKTEQQRAFNSSFETQAALAPQDEGSGCTNPHPEERAIGSRLEGRDYEHTQRKPYFWPGSEAVRVIETPFEVPQSGAIEIASISDSVSFSLPPGTYALRFEYFPKTVTADPIIRFLFMRRDNPSFKILRADAGLTAREDDLFLSASPA